MKYYINTCASDYFDKLAAFKNAKKVTVRYKPGDIFRVDFDRTHYGYGLITGTVKQFLSMKDLPEDHSLRSLMAVPIMIRPYKLLSSKSDLKAEDLSSVPLGRMMICSDNDIIWGTHAIVDHKKLEPNEIEFHLVSVPVHDICNRFRSDMISHIPQNKGNLPCAVGLFAFVKRLFDQRSVLVTLF